jgi:uncharacterized protein affecting Mg2+/Co2+ transport
VLLAAALPAGQAAADDWPALRAGMWEFNRTIETPGAQGKPQTMQTRKCTNPADDMKRQNDMLSKGGCKFSPVTRAGNTYSYSAVCNLQGASGTSKSVLTVESDAAYEIRIESDFGGEPTREWLRAKRTGDCRP